MRAFYRDLGRMEYAACWELQQKLFAQLTAAKRPEAAKPEEAERPERSAEPEEKKKPGAAAGEKTAEKKAAGETGEKAAGTDGPAEGIGTILLVEHPPVYTLGKSGRAENLLVSPEQLAAWGATFFRIDRGGDITFHGPGQLVCYPILDLEPLGIGLRDYIGELEECVIRTVAEYGIRAGRIAGASGVWITPEGERPRKICAIGVRSSRFVTMHGFALNVTTELAWFSRIHPCGFTDRGVASIASETGTAPSMEEVKRKVCRHLADVLGCELVAE